MSSWSWQVIPESFPLFCSSAPYHCSEMLSYRPISSTRFSSSR